MDQGVVGVIAKLSEGLEVLNMPVWFRNGARVESCKPCQGVYLRQPAWHVAMPGRF
jgi:hypothetical protein